jgi:hypothetical protein
VAFVLAYSFVRLLLAILFTLLGVENVRVDDVRLEDGGLVVAVRLGSHQRRRCGRSKTGMAPERSMPSRTPTWSPPATIYERTLEIRERVGRLDQEPAYGLGDDLAVSFVMLRRVVFTGDEGRAVVVIQPTEMLSMSIRSCGGVKVVGMCPFD